MKKISGPNIKNIFLYRAWARVQAKKGKKLVRAHRRNLGKVQPPRVATKPSKEKIRIAAKPSKKKKTKTKV